MDETDVGAICGSVPDNIRPQVAELVENLLFIAGKLRETRGKSADIDLVIPYDNGGGQCGFRKNPVFEAYNAMFAQYTKGLSLLNSILGDGAQAKPAKAKLTMITESVERLRSGNA